MKILRSILFVLFITAIVLYLSDALVFKLRGDPTSSITVNQLIAVPLKGNKTEYDSNGIIAVTCARSLFPQGSWNPCWYVVQIQKRPTKY